MEQLASISMWQQIGLSVAVFVLFLALRKIFTKYMLKFVIKLTKKTPTEFLSYFVLSFEKPLRWFFIVFGSYLALKYLPFELMEAATLVRLFRSSIILLLSWGFYHFASISPTLLSNLAEKMNIHIDKLVVPFLTKVARFIIAALAISVVAEEWGYNVNGFIAGLGLGGLAFALAAKDSIGNLFGGIIIITEKPFSIGDWIKTPSVEGTVEDINFRSTKVRTFAQALVTVPNATLANEPIVNWSKMGKRQVSFHLGVAYDTPKDKIGLCIERIESMLYMHEDVHNETIAVRFDRFNESSLDILVYFFTNTIVWSEYMKVKENINFQIMEILEEEGVSVAFPTRTLHIESEHTNLASLEVLPTESIHLRKSV